MLWTLVYIIMTQGSSGTLQTTAWPTDLRFPTQAECADVAAKAAPGLLTAGSTYVGPSGGINGPNPNAVTAQPMCVPTAK